MVKQNITLIFSDFVDWIRLAILLTEGSLLGIAALTWTDHRSVIHCRFGKNRQDVGGAFEI